MENKLSRIAAFIDSLPMESTLDDTQSAVLSLNVGVIGGDNGGDCSNKNYYQCFDAVNKGNCHNYYGYCNRSDNGGSCLNDDTVPYPNLQCGCGPIGE